MHCQHRQKWYVNWISTTNTEVSGHCLSYGMFVDIDNKDRSLLFKLWDICQYRFDIVNIDNKDRDLGIWNACQYRFDINIQDRGLTCHVDITTSIRIVVYRYRISIVSWIYLKTFEPSRIILTIALLSRKIQIFIISFFEF